MTKSSGSLSLSLCRVFRTTDCRKDFETLKARGVKFKDPSPVEAPFGIAVYFTDPDGNHLTLLQPRLRLRKPCHKSNNAEHQHKDRSSRESRGERVGEARLATGF